MLSYPPGGGLGVIAVELERLAAEQDAMPTLPRDELVEHTLVVRVLDEQVVDPRRLFQLSPQAIDPPLPLFKARGVPLEIEVDEVPAVSMKIDALGSHVGRDQDPRGERGGECLGDRVSLAARVVSRESGGERRSADGPQHSHRCALLCTKLVGVPGGTIGVVLVVDVRLACGLLLGADEVE